jgi:hypothetical protein
VGAQGIHRRKKWRKLPEVKGMNEGDIGRLFGRFTWGAYSPAGALERNGFFLRQLRRNGTKPGWDFVFMAKWVFITFGVVVAAIALVAHFA